MSYIIVVLLGMVGGGICVFVSLEGKRRKLADDHAAQDAREVKLKEALRSLAAKQQEVDRRGGQLTHDRAEFDARAISYTELRDENAVLKRDLRNIHVGMRKLELDRETQRQSQEQLDARGRELGSRYLKENVKWIVDKLGPNNFVACKQRLRDVIDRCRGVGLDVSPAEETALLADLKQEFEREVRAAFEREEQARIKARIREEHLLERERERELKQLERERAAIQSALDKALAEAKGQHNAEIERLQGRLAEAEAKAQRAISQAQLTKAGHVYVISNIGSFGDGVFKIGMTRRLEPLDRVRELGDASVPFPFDVHMMISCDDAPALENALHRTLYKMQMNKINPRKEFFRTDIEAIRKIVTDHHGEVQYVVDPEALQYRQSLEVSDEDRQYIESVYEKWDDEEGDAGTPES